MPHKSWYSAAKNQALPTDTVDSSGNQPEDTMSSVTFHNLIRQGLALSGKECKALGNIITSITQDGYPAMGEAAIYEEESPQGIIAAIRQHPTFNAKFDRVSSKKSLLGVLNLLILEDTNNDEVLDPNQF